MKRSLRAAGLGLLALFLVIQAIRPQRNLGAPGSPTDVTTRVAVPENVRQVLAEACYDCHSNRTRYPWYADLQPVGWWLGRHVADGKRELNFSEFGRYPQSRAGRKLASIARQVERGKMPLPSYTWLHPRARLTPEERRLLVDWANDRRAQFEVP